MLRNGIILAVTVFLGAFCTYLLDYTASVPLQAGQAETPDLQEAPQGSVVPAFTFTALDGKSYGIRDFNGKIVVLNFWASWCAPCVKEFPHFLDLAQEKPEDIIFVALSSDHDMAAMNRFVDSMRLQKAEAMARENVLIALDEKGVVTRGIFQTFRLPETILIDRNGVMRDKLVGANWTYEDLVAMIRRVDGL